MTIIEDSVLLFLRPRLEPYFKPLLTPQFHAELGDSGRFIIDKLDFRSSALSDVSQSYELEKGTLDKIIVKNIIPILLNPPRLKITINEATFVLKNKPFRSDLSHRTSSEDAQAFAGISSITICSLRVVFTKTDVPSFLGGVTVKDIKILNPTSTPEIFNAEVTFGETSFIWNLPTLRVIANTPKGCLTLGQLKFGSMCLTSENTSSMKKTVIALKSLVLKNATQCVRFPNCELELGCKDMDLLFFDWPGPSEPQQYKSGGSFFEHLANHLGVVSKVNIDKGRIRLKNNSCHTDVAIILEKLELEKKSAQMTLPLTGDADLKLAINMSVNLGRLEISWNHVIKRTRYCTIFGQKMRQTVELSPLEQLINLNSKTPRDNSDITNYLRILDPIGAEFELGLTPKGFSMTIRKPNYKGKTSSPSSANPTTSATSSMKNVHNKSTHHQNIFNVNIINISIFILLLCILVQLRWNK